MFIYVQISHVFSLAGDFSPVYPGQKLMSARLIRVGKKGFLYILCVQTGRWEEIKQLRLSASRKSPN